jgi:hypothetical protein
MAIYVSASDRTFSVPEPALYRAVCHDVWELFGVETRFGVKDMIEIRWQLEELNPDTGKPFEVRRRFTRSLNPKSNLYKTLLTWRGVPFTEEQLKQFDVESLIGANCLIQVTHRLDDQGRTWADVATVLNLKAKQNPNPLVVSLDYVRVKDRPTEHKVTPPPLRSAPTPVVEDDDDDIPF